jgi:hypothetical protein
MSAISPHSHFGRGVSPSVLERVRLARSRQTPWDAMAALAEDRSFLVRLTVALNFWTPLDLVRFALRDWVKRVRGAARLDA